MIQCQLIFTIFPNFSLVLLSKYLSAFARTTSSWILIWNVIFCRGITWLLLKICEMHDISISSALWQLIFYRLLFQSWWIVKPKQQEKHHETKTNHTTFGKSKSSLCIFAVLSSTSCSLISKDTVQNCSSWSRMSTTVIVLSHQ